VQPYGKATKAVSSAKQKGDPIEEKITKKNFKGATIAQGSGLEGFDAIRLFSNGSGYIVFSKERRKNKKVKIILTDEELEGFLVALNLDRVSEIKGLYSAGLHDGTQGFIEINTSKGRRHAWLDNYFEPVAHTYRYCNRVIWPKIIGARIVSKEVDRQDEYERIFNAKKAEQDGSGQPATAPQSKSQNNKNTKQESKVRPQ